MLQLIISIKRLQKLIKSIYTQTNHLFVINAHVLACAKTRSFSKEEQTGGEKINFGLPKQGKVDQVLTVQLWRNSSNTERGELSQTNFILAVYMVLAMRWISKHAVGSLYYTWYWREVAPAIFCTYQLNWTEQRSTWDACALPNQCSSYIASLSYINYLCNKYALGHILL